MAYIGNPPAPQNITSAGITDGTIVNVDIASDASIAATKIACLSTVATTGAYSDVTGTPTLATVATTGAYSDVTGTPTLATVATTGAYSDVTGTPTLATVATTGAYTDVTGTPTLATVATTGAYTDVIGTPTLATVATTGAYADITGTPTLPTDFVSAASGGTFSGDVSVTGEIIADSYNETYAALSGTTPTVNCETGNSFSLTLSGNTTFTFSNPPASGTSYTFSIEIIQDASASGYTVTWPTSVDWPAATAPTLTATASAKDIFVFTTRDGANWYGFTAGQALA